MKRPLLLVCCLFVLAGGLNSQTCPNNNNQCLQFDGLNDYVQMAGQAFAGTGSFTVEARFTCNTTTSTTRRLIALGSSSTSTSRFEIAVASGKLRIYWNNLFLTGQQISNTSVSNVSNNDWHHVAAVRNSSTNSMQCYLDGVLVYTVANLGATTLNVQLCRLGAQVSVIPTSSAWSGKIDEVRIWNTVRTQPQISENLNCQVNCTNSALVDYYRFDQNNNAGGANPNATSLVDCTAQPNNGVLNNFALLGTASNWVCGQETVFTNSVCAPACPAAFTAVSDNCGGFTFKNATTPLNGFTYAWNFGDGGTSTATNPTHTYASSNTYTVCLTVNSIVAPPCSTCQTIQVTINTAPPTITCPANQTVACNGTLQLTAPIVGNNLCSPTVGPTASRSDGQPLSAPYPAGATTVTWSASNQFGATSCSVVITGIDNLAPVILCKSKFVDFNAGQSTYTLVSSDVLQSATDNCCAAGTLTYNIIGQTIYTCADACPPAPKTVTLRVTDCAGNSSSCTAQVIVRDLTPPIAKCQPAVTVGVNNASTAILLQPSMVDNGSVDNCTIVSATVTPNTFSCAQACIQPITAVFIVTDCAGNTSTCTVQVSVRDLEPPKLTCPPNITYNTKLGQCTADVIDWGAKGTDLCTSIITYTYQLSGATTGNGTTAIGMVPFNVGTTLATFSASDACGNTKTCTATVIVYDFEQPTIICPPNQILNCNPVTNTAVLLILPPLVLEDNCLNVTVQTVTSLPSSVPCGTTGAVTYIAIDSWGNTAQCSFQVTAPPPSSCSCGGFSGVTFTQPGSAGLTQQVICGQSLFELSCTGGKTYSFAGNFACVSSTIPPCGPTNFGWTIVNGTGATVASGALTGAAFITTFSGNAILTPGNYTLTLSGTCGTSVCQCVIKLKVNECSSSCACGTFTGLTINRKTGIGSAPVLVSLACEQSTTMPCPVENFNWRLNGSFACAGPCSPTNMTWTIKNSEGTTVASGVMSASPFSVFFSGDAISTPGTYTVILVANCGTQVCRCVVPLVVEDCGGLPSCEANCFTDSLNLSTGFDQSSFHHLSDGNYDSEWTLIVSPDNGVTVPRAAYVVGVNQSWDTLSVEYPSMPSLSFYNYISAYPHFENNATSGYVFQNCFCICKDNSNITMDLKVHVDNNVKIDLYTEAGVFISNLYNVTSSTSSAFIDPPGDTTRTFALAKGTYCVRASLTNFDESSPMGLAIGCIVKGDGLIRKECCTRFNSIVGEKYKDTNCNGRRDNVKIEPGLPGWTIQLCDSLSGTLIATATTDAFGYYQFNNVSPGSYIIKEVNQSGWSQSEPVSIGYTVTIGDNEVKGPFPFGNCSSCEVISVSVTPTPVIPGQTKDCCYRINISNAVPATFASVNISVSGASLDVGDVYPATGTGWHISSFVSNVSAELEHSSGYVPTGSFSCGTICLTNITAAEQLITLQFLDAQGFSLCDTTLKVKCDYCALVTHDTIKCAEGNKRLMTFCIEAADNLGYGIESVILTSHTAGVTFTPSAFTISPPLDPGDPCHIITTLVDLGSSGFTGELCYTVTVHEGDVAGGKPPLRCCMIDHCTDLPDCLCDDQLTYATFEHAPPLKDGLCCYNIVLHQPAGAFVSVETVIISAGSILNGVGADPDWNANLIIPKKDVLWKPNPSGTLPAVATLPTLCFAGEAPQILEITWMTADSTFCTDELEFNCTDSICAVVDSISMVCNTVGGSAVIFKFEVTNTSGQTANHIALVNESPAGVITGQKIFPINLPNGASSGPLTTMLNNSLGANACFQINLYYQDSIRPLDIKDCCLTDTICFTMPRCTLQGLKQPIVMFPNPTRSEVTIYFGEGASANGILRVRDLTGRLLREEQVQAGVNVHKTSVEGFPSGLYFIEFLEGQQRIWADRIVKQGLD